HRSVRLGSHLRRVSAVDEQRRSILQHHREPGRAGKTRQPSEALSVGRHVFVLMLVRTRNDEACKACPLQLCAQFAHTMRAVRRVALFDEGLKTTLKHAATASLNGLGQAASCAVTTRPMNGNSR